MVSKQLKFHLTARLFFITLLVGVGAGLSGLFLLILLHVVQHLAYNYSLDLIIGSKSFLEGVSAAPPWRRIAAMTLCGLLAGSGWWLLYRYGRPLLSIPEIVKNDPTRMPRFKTFMHAILQIITVGLGSPLGREVAPREASVVFTSWLSTKLNLSLTNAKVMTACAAGAGLAAVYNVPLGGALFALETLLGCFSGALVWVALCSSVIAVALVRLCLGDIVQYQVSTLSINGYVLLWAFIMGPVLGFVAYEFKRVCTWMGSRVKHNWQVPVLCLFNFMIIGGLAVYFPELLGNGRSPAQLEFNNAISLQLTAILLILRMLIVFSSLRSGAHGGLLTPSLANGALLGVLLAGLCQGLNLKIPMSVFAIIGATAFLGVAQNMPLTAVVLVLEFTRVPLSFILPMGLATWGAMKTAGYYRHA